MSTRPSKWTDDDVRAYLVSTGIPVERYCTFGGESYGYFSDSEQRAMFNTECMICMDDLDDRAARIVRYLKKIGARDVAP